MPGADLLRRRARLAVDDATVTRARAAAAVASAVTVMSTIATRHGHLLTPIRNGSVFTAPA